MRVIGLWTQPDARAPDGPAISSALGELAAWLGADDVSLETPVPAPWTRSLRA